MMSNKNKSRIRQYGSFLLCSILCVVFLVIPARAADLEEDIDAFRMIVNGECGVFSPRLMEVFRKVRMDFEKLE